MCASLSLRVRVAVVVLLLRFAHPDWYPSTRGPLLSLASAGGLADEDVRGVQELLEQSVEEHLGMVMVFNFLEIAKEEARRRIRARSAASATASGAGDEKATRKQDELAHEQGTESVYQASLRAAAAESERLKDLRRIGTLVTADVFVSWRRQYDEDMRCARGERLKQAAAVIMTKGANTNDTTLSGMTGKEFFQSGKHLGSRSGKATHIQRDAGGETSEFTEDGGDDEWSDYEDESDDEEDILEALAATHSGGGADAGEDEAVLDS